VANDLERRRLAIVEALRAVMAEPHRIDEATEPTQPESTRTEPAPAGRHPAWLAPMDELDESAEWDEEWEELDDPDRPVVPPLEAVGAMSSRASLALFGHA